MVSITIRRLDDSIKAKLRVRAAKRVGSMEEEAREILKIALSAKSEAELDFGKAIRRHIAPLGGVELELPKREPYLSVGSLQEQAPSPGTGDSPPFPSPKARSSSAFFTRRK